MIWPTSRLRRLFRPPAEIYRDAAQGKQFDAVYFVMLILACLIALLGLLLNSPAVIIGAMLISPLMGPILACGVALTAADWDVGKKAARNVVLSVVEAIVMAVIAIRVSPLRETTPEILARTTPNMMDLLIAFFSGTAGTAALSSRKAAMTILPGVAIATAVVPPLAIVGYGIGTLQWSIASGALMLFLTNFAAIVLSAGLVFLVVGVRPQKVDQDGQNFLSRHRIAIAFLILAGLSVPLMKTLKSAAHQAQIRQQLSAHLRSQLQKSKGRHVDSVKLQIAKDHVSVVAVVQTSQFIEPQEVHALGRELSTAIGRPVRLEIQQLQLAKQEADRSIEGKDYLGGELLSQGESQGRIPFTTATIAKAQDGVQTSLTSLLVPAGVSDLTVLSLGMQPNGTLLVKVEATQKENVGQAAWQVAAESVSLELGVPLLIRADVIFADRSLELKLKPGAVRLTQAQSSELQKFIRNSSGPNRYLLTYSVAVSPELAKRRIVLLGRHVRALDLSSEPDPKLPTNLILVRGQMHLEITGGQMQGD
ncbi:MAG: TIGR00341 family protein [Acidobacteriota bacterium]|nr:TIGR00341 family protein [Acidobacteriota bacterium]